MKTELLTEISHSGTPLERLIKNNPHKEEAEILQQVSELIREDKIYQKGDSLYLGKPEKKTPGRPVLAEKRQQITIRLPGDMVEWLRSQKNYTQKIEKLLRAEMIKTRDQWISKAKN